MSDIRKIRIYAPTFSATTAFICQFNDRGKKGKTVSLVNNGTDGRYVEDQLPPNTEVKALILDKNFRYEFSCDLDDKGNPLTINYTEYWSRDPRVLCRSGRKNPNYEVPHLFLEDLTSEKEQKVVSIRDIRKALAKYETLSEKTQRNVAYYFGVINADTVGKDPDALYILLCDPVGGKILQSENIQRFLDYNPDDEQVQLQINARRAIEKGIIEQREASGKNTFFINNHPIGDTEEAVIAYLDLNPEFYSTYIVEKLGDIAEKAKQEAKQPQEEEVIETADVEQLRKRCKALFEEGKALGIKNAKAGRWAQFVNPATMAKDLQDAITEMEGFIAEKKAKEVMV